VATEALRELVALAIREDLSAGDVTSEAIFDASAVAGGVIVAREDLVLCGTEAAREVWRVVDPTVVVALEAADGERLARGDVALRLGGSVLSILAGERTALNFLQRLSGVATWTARHVAEVAGTECRVTDTRKTTPGWRALEKHAVRCGGGTNHRFHLGDGVLIKDNHVAAAGGVADAVRLARGAAHHLLKVQVECDTPAQVAAALEAGADAILLDNMSPAEVADAVALCGGRVSLEASGGITLEKLAAYAATGVDRVSMGALTHSAPAADLALDLEAP